MAHFALWDQGVVWVRKLRIFRGFGGIPGLTRRRVFFVWACSSFRCYGIELRNFPAMMVMAARGQRTDDFRRYLSESPLPYPEAYERCRLAEATTL
jgi:hypothetical protein